MSILVGPDCDELGTLTGFIFVANVKNCVGPVNEDEILILVLLFVPQIDVYVPDRDVPFAMTCSLIPVGFVNDTELLIKLPVVANDQYSELLFDNNVPSTVPPEFPLKACAFKVIAPVVVVGLTISIGK